MNALDIYLNTNVLFVRMEWQAVDPIISEQVVL